MTRKLRTTGLIVFAAVALMAAPCRAQSFEQFGTAVQDYFLNWFPRVTQIQSEQPHWVTPLVTVTPRLEEELRYDQYFESMRDGVATNNFGAGKGVELIPFQNTEVIIGIPGWLNRNKPPGTDGFADWPFLIKYRILSANEENGNYILTAFMGFSVPTGSNVNGNGHALFTPTIAFGKGFGDFDFQSTVGVTFPNGGHATLDRLGMPLAWNTAFQYRVFKYFWPEVETNYSWQSYGNDNGHNTLYITPGIIVGRIPIHDRVGLTFGLGEQVAVTYHRTYDHNFILTGRIPF